MRNLVRDYTNWLHTRWPAGVTEKLPRVNPDGSTNIKGLYVVGDLTGIPLLKFSAHTGARAVNTILEDPDFKKPGQDQAEPGIRDLVIIGGGVSGMSAALEARKAGIDFEVLEATEPFSTIVNFPKGKPIYAYPTEMVPDGELQFRATVKEPLVEELRAQTLDAGIEPRFARSERVVRKGGMLEVVLAGEENLLARRVIVAIGRSGNFRKLGVPGEDLDLVSNRLHDPKDFVDKDVLVVGGGDSALETAIAVAQCGGRVTLSYRKKELSRPKPENVERLEKLAADPMADVGVETPSSERVTTSTGGFLGRHRKAGSIQLELGSRLKRIGTKDIVLVDAQGDEKTLPNDAVFSMIGREAPLDFFRRSGVKILGETVGLEWVAILAFFLVIFSVYDWKEHGFIYGSIPALESPTAFPNEIGSWISGLGAWWADQVADRSTVIGTIAVSMKSRSFYYTLAYTTAIGLFGIARVRRRRTPYVKAQTLTLFLIQLFPLFLLPELLLPWMGYNGLFDTGAGRAIADSLFELYIDKEQYLAHDWPDWGHPRAYWRAYGLILFWPLNVYNVFTSAPIAGWLVICTLQTFVLLPLIIRYLGKGGYCGWICSCGGLAETMGDSQRHKMPHGAFWNRMNMVGQVILLVAFVLLALRIIGWIFPGSIFENVFLVFFEGKGSSGSLMNPVSWKWIVDVTLAGMLGTGLYFKYSGRVWCRFACPLASLMHIYARFSRFRIFAEKKKCISCNACTSICHMGIDVMNFANKGLPMEDPECVRCSACVQTCPTGVLQFGQIDPKTGDVLKLDKLAASPVRMAEAKAQG